MRLYIDCEFNGGGGELMSMALVAEDGEHEFYEVLPLPEKLVPWVDANVVPILNKAPIPYEEFQRRLFAFLNKFPLRDIVADHPADIAYFANALILDRMGLRYGGAWSAHMLNGVPYISRIPHNALEDARAIQRVFHGGPER